MRATINLYLFTLGIDANGFGLSLFRRAACIWNKHVRCFILTAGQSTLMVNRRARLIHLMHGKRVIAQRGY